MTKEHVSEPQHDPAPRIPSPVAPEPDGLSHDRLDAELATILRFIREAVDPEAIEGCAPAECVALVISQRDNAQNALAAERQRFAEIKAESDEGKNQLAETIRGLRAQLAKQQTALAKLKEFSLLNYAGPEIRGLIDEALENKVPSAPLYGEIERLTKERDEAIAALPFLNGKTKNEARALLGEVLRHVTDERLQSSHGCVEVTNAVNVVERLIAGNTALRAQLAAMTAERDEAIAHSDRWERQVKEWEKDRDAWRGDALKAIADRDRLAQRLKEAVEDKDVVDFLEKHWEFFPRQSGCRENIPNQGILTWISHGDSTALRSAVHAARSQGATAQPETGV